MSTKTAKQPSKGPKKGDIVIFHFKVNGRAATRRCQAKVVNVNPDGKLDLEPAYEGLGKRTGVAQVGSRSDGIGWSPNPKGPSLSRQLGSADGGDGAGESEIPGSGGFDGEPLTGGK